MFPLAFAAAKAVGLAPSIVAIVSQGHRENKCLNIIKKPHFETGSKLRQRIRIRMMAEM